MAVNGSSLGSAVSVRLAKELCEEGTPPGALILESPFTTLPDAAAALYWFIPARYMVVEKYPSIDHIKLVTCPLLVLHAEDDEVVPFRQGERLFGAAPDASASGIAKRFVAFSCGGHNHFADGEPVKYDQALRQFLGDVKFVLMK